MSVWQCMSWRAETWKPFVGIHRLFHEICRKLSNIVNFPSTSACDITTIFTNYLKNMNKELYDRKLLSQYFEIGARIVFGYTSTQPAWRRGTDVANWSLVTGQFLKFLTLQTRWKHGPMNVMKWRVHNVFPLQGARSRPHNVIFSRLYNVILLAGPHVYLNALQQVTFKTLSFPFSGIGFGICFIATYVAFYYNTIIAWAVYYMFASMRAEVPWTNCNNSWNTDDCLEFLNRTSASSNTSKSPAYEFFK
jgi:hypothetical protein